MTFDTENSAPVSHTTAEMAQLCKSGGFKRAIRGAQRFQPNVLPAKIAFSAVARLLPARHFSGNYAISAFYESLSVLISAPTLKIAQSLPLISASQRFNCIFRLWV